MEDSNSPNQQPASQALPQGYELDEYVIEKEIGAGGFGVTYKAYDKQLDRYVAIKEYFPFNLASRDDRMNVSPKTRVAQDVDEYTWGLSRFIQEARTLALFEHPSIIRVIRYIERNSTAYIIMDFADGRDVSDVLQNEGLLSLEALKAIILPIAEGLSSVHSSDMLHRDIKPANIRVKANGKAVLIDFGAARQAIGLRSQSISTILTPGYAPIEQYSTRGNQGPWTDIYALAAVGYVCLTGENLSHYEATERIRNDQLPRLVDRIKSDDQAFLAALDWALSPEESDRPQTVQEWLLAIENGVIPNSGSLASSAEATKRIAESGKSEPRSSVKNKAGDRAGSAEEKKTPFSLGMVVVVFGLVVGGAMFFLASDMGEPVADNQIVMNAAKVEDEERASAEKGENIRERVTEVPSGAKKPKAVDSTRPAATPVVKPKDFTQDDRDFETASKINTAEAYELYARLHPNGRHRTKTTRSRY